MSVTRLGKKIIQVTCRENKQRLSNFCIFHIFVFKSYLISFQKLRKPTRVKNNKRKKCFSRTNENIFRRNEKFSSTNEKKIRTNEKNSRGNEKISRSNEKNSRTNEKLSRTDEDISRTNEKISRTNEKKFS